MNGWVAAILLALLTGGALIASIRAQRGLREMMAAAVVLGLAGYAWQGLPSLPAAPREGRAVAKPFDEALVTQRRGIADRYGPARQWLTVSDGLARSGDTRGAVNVLTAGLRAEPRDPNLWLGLGNALVAHSDGIVSPSARYAFGRAIALDPKAPGAAYFYGLALARSGELGEAQKVWRALLDRTPPEASWREDLAIGLALVDRALGTADSGKNVGNTTSQAQ